MEAKGFIPYYEYGGEEDKQEDEIPSYNEFVVKYGSRPKDIIYNMAVKLTKDYFEAQLAKVREHKLDRPALRREIIRLLSSGMLRRGDALDGEGELVEDDTYLFLTKEYKGVLADQLLPLFDEEEIRKQEREKVMAELAQIFPSIFHVGLLFDLKGEKPE